MKELNIYDVRTTFLESKGFQQAWGAPVEVFVKLLESIKQKDKDAKAEISKIEKAFDQTLESIMTTPENFNTERIKFFIEEKMSLSSSIMGGVKSSQAGPAKVPFQPPAAPVGVSKSMGQPPKKKDEDNLDDLMMMELMNRSAEEPKEE